MSDPIKLLDFYKENDRDILFGRAHEIKSLMELIAAYPIVVLSGESGTGKTSLLRAGLIPNVSDNWEVLYHRMTSESNKYLPGEFLSHFPVTDGNSTSFEGVILEFLKQVKGESKKYLVILDQFEELLVEYNDRKEWFPVSLLSRIETSGMVQFLFCLRSDYLPLFMNWLHPTRLHFFAEQFYYLPRFSLTKAREVLQHMVSFYDIDLDYAIYSAITSNLASLDIEGTVYPPHLQIIASYIVEKNSRDGVSKNIIDSKELKIEKILTEFFNKELFKGMTEEHRGIVKQILDTLVGREGLRRKMTLEDISERVQWSKEDLAPLLNTLIERRTLRRNQEDKFELIHDFLSRHFFESFSSEEKHNRRLQDMFTAAIMDYRDAGIFLDERRIRLFLHYRSILDLDKDARIFLIKSVLSLFVIGYNPYLDLSMNQDLLELLSTENNKDNRLSMIGKLSTLAGYNDLPVLKELYEKETDYLAKSDLLTLIADYDPQWVKTLCEGFLTHWENLHDTFLEGILRAIRLCIEPSLTRLILPILIGHRSDNIQLTAIETIEILKDSTVIPDLLSLLEEKHITLPRVIDSCILTIDNLFFYIRDKEEYDILKDRFISLLKRLIYKSVYVSQPNAFTAYIKYAVPDPSECEALLTTTRDNYNIDSIIRTMGDIGDPGYRDPLLFFINNTTDNTYIESAIYTLGRLKGKVDPGLYHQLYKTYTTPTIRGSLLDNLIDINEADRSDADLVHLLHEIINNRNEVDTDLLLKAISGLSKIGNEDDINLVADLFKESHDQTFRELAIHSISDFNSSYSETIKAELKQVWTRETDDVLRIAAGCKLFLLGDVSLYPFLLERLEIIDEHFERYIQQSFFVLNKDSVLEIFRTFCIHSGPYPETETTIKTLQDIVLYSANREYACIALSLLGSRFGNSPDMQSWFFDLMGTANRPELRGLALLCLTKAPVGSVFDSIEDRIFNANWPIIQKYGIYALGLLDCEDSDHQSRVQLLDRFIRETSSYDLLEHALWVFNALASKDDRWYLENLLRDEETMKIRNSYFVQRIEKILYTIENIPMEDRALPGLGSIYKMVNYWWRQSLRLSPLMFSF